MDLIALEMVDDGKLSWVNPEYVVAIEDAGRAGITTRVFLTHPSRPFVDVKGGVYEVAQQLCGLVDDGQRP